MICQNSDLSQDSINKQILAQLSILADGLASLEHNTVAKCKNLGTVGKLKIQNKRRG